MSDPADLLAAALESLELVLDGLADINRELVLAALSLGERDPLSRDILIVCRAVEAERASVLAILDRTHRRRR